MSQQLPIVTRFTEQRLTQLQQETAIPTPPRATLTTQEIVPPSTPTKVLKTKLEVVAGAFVLMFVGTLILIAVVDNVRRRWSGKRRSVRSRTAPPPIPPWNGPTTRWGRAAPPTGTPRTPRHPRECDERRDDDLSSRGGGFPAARPGAGGRSADGDQAPARPSKVRRPRHSKPRFSSVTLFTTYLVVLLLIPSNLVFAPMGGVGTPANIIALGILLWYVISWIVGRIMPSGACRPVRVSMFIFALAVLASFVAGMTRSITELESLSADRGLILIVVFAALVVVASQTIVSYERLDTLLRRAVVLGSVVAAIGIAEFYTGINITNYVHIPGLSPAVDVNSLLDRNGFNRPSSTATQPIEFGVVMAMLLPFALQQAFDPARTGRFRRWAPVALLFFAIPMSLSRSGIVGLAIALLWIIPTWPTQRRKPAYVVLLIGIASLKVVAPGLIGTFAEYFGGLSGSSNSDVSISTRTADYAAAFRYIGERPLFGRDSAPFSPSCTATSTTPTCSAWSNSGLSASWRC